MRTNFIAIRKAYIIQQKEKTFLPIKEIAQLAKLNIGNPKRIVCQCEQVREKIIQEAITRPPYPLSIDAIKKTNTSKYGILSGKDMSTTYSHITLQMQCTYKKLMFLKNKNLLSSIFLH